MSIVTSWRLASWFDHLSRKGEQPPWIVADSLWERIEPLLPKVERRRRHPGRKRKVSIG